ncbi:MULTISPECIES: hypothetical protein [Rheinheimera]|uniref:hypothetical protein n=1 Tax=Rheinheimera TaxID=67575 RepID=UPI001E5E8658|nr:MULTISPECIES: hypothetical protein [Rheinheimera]MDF3126580.1 hypothetical protein [Rheinheimera sp. 1928-s]
MGEFGYTVDKLFWVGSFLLLIVSVVYKLDISSRVALTVWVVGNLFMDLIQPFVMAVSTNNAMLGSSFWYVTWAAIEILCVWCIYKVHVVHDLPASKLTRYIMVCLLALCTMQLIRYADRLIFETDLLYVMYKYVIVAINISVVPFTALWFAKEIVAIRKGAFL